MSLGPRPFDQASPPVRVLAERAGVVLAYKPAPWATEPTAQSADSLVGELARLLGTPRVHAASRLDVGVSGVVLCTVGSEAARQVEALRASGRLYHGYLGIARGALAGEGSWSWALGRGRDLGGRVLARPNAEGARPATTHYAALAIAGEATLLCLRLATGRMHQIRAHAARARLPLLGDRRYGGPPTVVDASGRVHEIGRIALHCQRVELHEWLAAEAPASDELGPLWQQLGGTDAAWALASEWGRAAKLMP